MDSSSYRVALVTISADGDGAVYLTNGASPVVYASNVFVSSPDMAFDLPDKTGAATSDEGTIKNISTNLHATLSRIASGYPYNQIKIKVEEVELDDTLSVTSSKIHFQGLVYQSMPRLVDAHMDLVVRDWKYYMDLTAGVPCIEQCWVKRFGDKICQATVESFPVTINTVDGYDVILDSVPTAVDYYFNKGYFKLNDTSIKIKFWESGTTFQTSEAMPESWEGSVVTLVAGCDKTLDTCRNIHDNEERFSGWGYSMVDYDPQYEDAS